MAIIASHPGSGEALDAGGSITGAEVIHAIRNEMSVRLSDIVLRRLSLSDRHPGRDVVRACAAIAARGLGWSDEETQEQIAEVERAYHVP